MTASRNIAAEAVAWHTADKERTAAAGAEAVALRIDVAADPAAAPSSADLEAVLATALSNADADSAAVPAAVRSLLAHCSASGTAVAGRERRVAVALRWNLRSDADCSIRALPYCYDYVWRVVMPVSVVCSFPVAPFARNVVVVDARVLRSSVIVTSSIATHACSCSITKLESARSVVNTTGDGAKITRQLRSDANQRNGEMTSTPPLLLATFPPPRRKSPSPHELSHSPQRRDWRFGTAVLQSGDIAIDSDKAWENRDKALKMLNSGNGHCEGILGRASAVRRKTVYAECQPAPSESQENHEKQ
ncbi:hypothetical protein MRB53_037493 [Persea americana]|nr:hypothetical protein MRB53_037493 [Persea americana]